MMKLNQMFTNSIDRRYCIWGVYTREKYLCKNFGAKERESVCPKGAYFRELTVKFNSTLGI